MTRPFQKRVSGPPLSPETLRRVDILFPVEDWERAKALLHEQCGNNLPGLGNADEPYIERFRFAALKYSDGNFSKLEDAVRLAQKDWRDLLMAVGFGDPKAHLNWEPKPAAEPAEVDPLALAAKIHDRLAALLTPLGFLRQGDEWRRNGEVPQSLRVITGLTSRVEVKFFLRATFEAEPMGVVLNLPRLPANPMEGREQGYVFRTGDDAEVFGAAMMEVVIRHVAPWFERFTSASEVRQGFEDGTFKRHLPVEGRALIF
jgi:hypothetical protein